MTLKLLKPSAAQVNKNETKKYKKLKKTSNNFELKTKNAG